MKPVIRVWQGLLACLALALLPARISCQVVINEVCYDPDGADSGKEWIELYNSGNTDVNLAGARIFSGGANFGEVFEFPHFILRAHHIVLIGDALVEQAVFVTPLAFQNGGAETDAIRYLSPDGSYTDTVLYDSPNSNGLPDDTGLPATSFAVDVPESYSLARRMDGYDTNDCAADFYAEQEPTPGLPNRVRVDYALLHPSTWKAEGVWQFGVWTKNLADISPVISADLRIYLDGIKIDDKIVSDLAAGDSLLVVASLPVEDDLNHQVTAELDLENDPDPGNNSVTVDLFALVLRPPVINELMYHPETGKPEWIELWVQTANIRGDYKIIDAAENECTFSLPGYSGYFVLCSTPGQFLAHYPDCPASAVIGTSGWTVLNNDSDSITLQDSDGNSIDQMSYSGGGSHQGKSLERYLDSSQQVAWRHSLDLSGSTPGKANSQSVPVPEYQNSVRVEGSPCNPQNGETINLVYKLDSAQSRVNCRVYDLSGCLVRILADYTMITAEGMLTWNGMTSTGRIAPRGRYYISWESRPTDGTKTFRRQFSAVVFY